VEGDGPNMFFLDLANTLKKKNVIRCKLTIFSK
jgi:hypothetical protein